MARTIRPKTYGIHYFSPSQIDLFLSCPRAWAWRYLRGIKGPDKASAMLGTATHAVLEKYLETGETLPFSDPNPLVAQAAEVAAPALEFLPKPGTPGLVIEEEFTFQLGDVEHAGVRYPLLFLGYKDLRVPAEVSESGLPEVIDHKTSSNINAYAKTVESLPEDSQAVIYAYDEMRQTGSDKVQLRWSYMQTRGAKKIKRVTLPMLRDDVEPKMQKIAYLAAQLLPTILTSAGPETFGVDTKACNSYGGCPYRELCAPLLTHEEKVAGLMSNDQDFLDLIGKIEKNVAAIPSAMPRPSTPAPTPAPAASADLDDLLGPSTPAPAAKFGPVNPPVDAGPAVEPTPAIDPLPNPIVAIVAAPVAEAPAASKRRGGRPAGSYNKPKEAAPVVEDERQMTLPSVAAAVQTPDVEFTIVAKSCYPGPGFTLYVDCMPYGVDVTFAEEVFAMAQKAILAEKGLADYRFIKYEGAGIFAAALTKLVADGALAGMRIVMNSSTPEALIAASVLMPAAQFPVVRGMR